MEMTTALMTNIFPTTTTTTTASLPKQQTNDHEKMLLQMGGSGGDDAHLIPFVDVEVPLGGGPDGDDVATAVSPAMAAAMRAILAVVPHIFSATKIFFFWHKINFFCQNQFFLPAKSVFLQ
jgi:hypothetical protein